MLFGFTTSPGGLSLIADGVGSDRWPAIVGKSPVEGAIPVAAGFGLGSNQVGTVVAVLIGTHGLRLLDLCPSLQLQQRRKQDRR